MADWNHNMPVLEVAPGRVISSFYEYMSYAPTTLNWSENPRITKLSNFQDYLLEKQALEPQTEIITDPITHLHKLYFWDGKTPWLSVELLWQEVRDKGINYANSDGLHKMLTDFWWILKDTGEKSVEWWQNSAHNSYNMWKAQQSIWAFKEWLLSILWTDTTQEVREDFDIETYNSIKYPIDKVLYLFALENVSMWDFSHISGLWKWAMSTAANALLSDIQQKIKYKYGIDIELPQVSDANFWNKIRKSRPQQEAA